MQPKQRNSPVIWTRFLWHCDQNLGLTNQTFFIPDTYQILAEQGTHAHCLWWCTKGSCAHGYLWSEVRGQSDNNSNNWSVIKGGSSLWMRLRGWSQKLVSVVHMCNKLVYYKKELFWAEHAALWVMIVTNLILRQPLYAKGITMTCH